MGKITWFFFVYFLYSTARSQENQDSAFIANNFVKVEQMIPMRDGVRLFTSIYTPKDQKEKYPFLMERTPYSCAPYGEKNYPKRWLGPDPLLMQDKYIFVYQDVRGRYKSEGVFDEMTPAKETKKSAKDTDESSDTFDTIEWLLKNVANNNGRVGIYGISYPGFYATASLPSAHPAIKAVSPQAPVTDEFIGDDAYHNGAFFLLDNFDFTNYFQGTRIDSGENYKDAFEDERTDAYAFFKTMEPLTRTNSSRYFNHKAQIWNEYLGHDTYDEYWKKRNIRTHLNNISPAVLVVGGWFDAEDMFGSLRTYEAIKNQSPATKVTLVMGPWTHGEWFGVKQLGFPTYNFESQNKFYHDEIESKFFNYYLKDKGDFNLPGATVFETGTSQWKHFSEWPPASDARIQFYLSDKKQLTKIPSAKGFDEYLSDPANPVPYTNEISSQRNSNYLVEDQRFAASRPDVLTFQTDTLADNVTVTGRVKIDMFISTTGTDADIVVKLIDVMPDDEPDVTISATVNHVKESKTFRMAGVQRLQRADVFRCKFRNSFEKPEPLVPGKVEEIKFNLNEIAHTFKKGHRIMVQVQSSWFPLVDLNPQKFTDIPTCSERDFQKATIRLYHNSNVTLPIVKQ